MNKKIISIIMNCLLLTIVFFMILSSNEVIETVAFSISIWKDNLFPTLFPFFVISNLLLQYGFVDIIGRMLSYPMNNLFHLPGCCSFVLSASLVSGFPSGAKYTKDLVEKQLINKSQAERLLTFTHYSNPLFILGMIGNIILGNQKIAYLILIAHILSGLLVGMIFRPKDYPKNETVYYQSDKGNKAFGQLLTESITSSLNTMFLLLGIVTIFLIISTIIRQIIPTNQIMNTIISGILEMTQGVKSVSYLNVSLLIKTIIIEGIISFGGLSVHAQVLGIVSTEKIKYKYFFLARIIHSMLAIILVSILYIIFYTSSVVATI